MASWNGPRVVSWRLPASEGLGDAVGETRQIGWCYPMQSRDSALTRRDGRGRCELTVPHEFVVALRSREGNDGCVRVRVRNENESAYEV